MTFQDGVNRPPRRQSTKNIDFRRLADVNDDDEKEYFTVDIKKCRICQQIVDKNKSIQKYELIDLVDMFRRIFVDMSKSELKIDSADNFCSDCFDKLVRLKTIEDESEKIKRNLFNLFSNSKTIQHEETGAKVFASFEDLDLRSIRLQVVNVETGRLERNVEANNQGSQRPLLKTINRASPPSVCFLSVRELGELGVNNKSSLQVTKESLKRLFGQHEVSSNGKLSIASHDVMQAKVWVNDVGLFQCLNHCQMCFESQLGLLNHLTKLGQNSETSEISRVENFNDDVEPFDENEVENSSSKHKCELCNLNFNESEELSHHLKVEHSDDLGSVKTDLEEHQKPSNQDLKPFSCSTCGKGFTRKAYLFEHEARHKGLKDRECPICKKKFYNTSFWRHMSVTHAENGKLVHECSKCDRKFSHLFLLKNHEQSHLPYQQRQFMCKKCLDGKRFPTLSRLKAHEKQVHGSSGDSGSDDSKLCSDCGAIFHSASSYNLHRKRYHSKDEENRLLAYCDECPLTFATLASLRRHMQSAHPKITTNLENQSFVPEEEIEEIETDFGKETILEIQTFDDVSQLSIDPNNEIYFKEDDEVTSSNSVTYGSVSRDEQAYIFSNNIVTPSGQFLFRTTSGDELTLARDDNSSTAHHFVESSMPTVQVFSLPPFTQEQVSFVESLSTTKPSFPCGHCDKVFASAKTRSQHNLNMHASEKTYICKICQNIFASKADLKEHGKSHAQEKPFRCSTCDKAFKMSKDLKRHIRVHTGEKPFKCNDCDKRFSSSSNLSEHRTLHTGKMNYECKQCKKRFRLWTTLKKHSLRCSQPTTMSTTAATAVTTTEPVSMTSLDFGMENSQETFHTDHLVLAESLGGSAIYVFD